MYLLRLSLILISTAVLTQQFCPDLICSDVSCYCIYSSDSMTWYQYRSLCQSINLDLVSINSAEEQSFLEQNVLPRPEDQPISVALWIGGYNSTWVDCSSMVYTNFGFGAGSPATDCVLIAAQRLLVLPLGQWITYDCNVSPGNSILKGAICEKPNCNQVRGFHNIAHLANTPRVVDWAAANGATGVSIDLQFDELGNVLNFQHGGSCDCTCYCPLATSLPLSSETSCQGLVPNSVCAQLEIDFPANICNANTDAAALLASIACTSQHTQLSTVVIKSHLPGSSGIGIQVTAGQNAAQLVVDHLFGNQYKGQVIFSSPSDELLPYLEATVETMDLYADLSSKVHYSIDRDIGPNGAADVSSTLAAQFTLLTTNLVYSTGYLACESFPNATVSEEIGRLAAYNEAHGVVGLSLTRTLNDAEEIVKAFYYYHGAQTAFPGLVASLAASHNVSLAETCTNIPPSTSNVSVESTAGFKCVCAYHSSTDGCQISSAAPANLACRCEKVQIGESPDIEWECSGAVVACRDVTAAECETPSTTVESCYQGYGDCFGY